MCHAQMRVQPRVVTASLPQSLLGSDSLLYVWCALLRAFCCSSPLAMMTDVELGRRTVTVAHVTQLAEPHSCLDTAGFHAPWYNTYFSHYKVRLISFMPKL